jgi:hypothetical protein
MEVAAKKVKTALFITPRDFHTFPTRLVVHELFAATADGYKLTKPSPLTIDVTLVVLPPCVMVRLRFDHIMYW